MALILSASTAFWASSKSLKRGVLDVFDDISETGDISTSIVLFYMRQGLWWWAIPTNKAGHLYKLKTPEWTLFVKPTQFLMPQQVFVHCIVVKNTVCYSSGMLCAVYNY
jgi:hypothetical protein